MSEVQAEVNLTIHYANDDVFNADEPIVPFLGSIRPRMCGNLWRIRSCIQVGTLLAPPSPARVAVSSMTIPRLPYGIQAATWQR